MTANPKDTRDNSVKKFNQLLSKSSQKLLSTFLNGDEKKSRSREKLRKDLLTAAARKQLVVLQVSSNNSFQTLTGQLFRQSDAGASFGLKLQQNDELRIIPFDQIIKVRVLPTNRRDKAL